MSMNLCFDVILGSWATIHKDFPFQTPTDMTFKVLVGKTKEEQCQILREEMAKYNWDNWEELYEECRKEIMNPSHELGYI